MKVVMYAFCSLHVGSILILPECFTKVNWKRMDDIEIWDVTCFYHTTCECFFSQISIVQKMYCFGNFSSLNQYQRGWFVCLFSSWSVFAPFYILRVWKQHCYSLRYSYRVNFLLCIQHAKSDRILSIDI